MRHIRRIATYSCRLEAPQNIRHPKSKYAATRHVLFTRTVCIDWIHVSKHQQPLPRFQTARLTPLSDEANKLHQHSHVSSTHASVNALWCAVKRDSLRHHNITYLARDGSRFCVMTLTFNLITCNVCSASAVTWPKTMRTLPAPWNFLYAITTIIAVPKFKSRSRDLVYVPFRPTFLLLILYSLHFVYVLHKTLVALAVS